MMQKNLFCCGQRKQRRDICVCVAEKKDFGFEFLLCALHCVLLLPFDLGSLFIVIYLFLGHFSLLLMVVIL